MVSSTTLKAMWAMTLLVFSIGGASPRDLPNQHACGSPPQFIIRPPKNYIYCQRDSDCRSSLTGQRLVCCDIKGQPGRRACAVFQSNKG